MTALTFHDYPIDQLVGLSSDPQDALLKIYPNPAANAVKIDFPRLQGVAEISVLDAMGCNIYSRRIADGSAESYRLKVANWPRGYYIIRLRDDAAQYTSLLLLQ